MKTLYHAAAGISSLTCLLIFLVATINVEYSYSAPEMIAAQGVMLQTMWVYIPLIFTAGGIGYILSKERKERIVQVKKRRMVIIIAVSLFILMPCIYTLANAARYEIAGTIFSRIEILEVLSLILLIALLGLNARDGARLTSDRPTAD